jgi:hypothetical protein
MLDEKSHTIALRLKTIVAVIAYGHQEMAIVLCHEECHRCGHRMVDQLLPVAVDTRMNSDGTSLSKLYQTRLFQSYATVVTKLGMFQRDFLDPDTTPVSGICSAFDQQRTSR